MKSTSGRFKVSVLMKVLVHRHHPSAELQNQRSLAYHKLVLVLSCSNKESIQCRKQHQNWLQLRASISKSPLAVNNSSLQTTSVPIGNTAPTVTVPDCRGPKKSEAESIIKDNWLQPTEFGSWKNIFKSEVSHSSQYPRAALLWIGEVDVKSTSPTTENGYENCTYTARISTRAMRTTSMTQTTSTSTSTQTTTRASCTCEHGT